MHALACAAQSGDELRKLASWNPTTHAQRHRLKPPEGPARLLGKRKAPGWGMRRSPVHFGERCLDVLGGGFRVLGTARTSGFPATVRVGCVGW